MITTSLVLLLVLIGISIPVGAALGVLGLILDPLYSMLPLTRAMGEARPCDRRRSSHDTCSTAAKNSSTASITQSKKRGV